MRIKTAVLFLSLSYLILFMAGCGSAPQELIDNAKTALESAKSAEADQYVPDRYAAAKNALDGAMAEVDKQNSKFLFKNYSDAETMLNNAITLAKEAESAAIARKEEVKKELPQMIEQLENAIKEVTTLMKKAPRGKEGMMALQSIQNDVNSLEKIVPEAKSAMQNENYMSAFNKTRSGLDKANSLIKELNQAIGRAY